MARTKRAVAGGAVATSVSALVMLTAPTAGASNFSGASYQGGPGWSCAGVNMTDSGDWTYAFYDLATNTANASFASIYNQFNPTHLNAVNVSPDSNTDAVVLDEYYNSTCGLDWAGSVIGLTVCESLSGSGTGKCNRHNVRFDRRDMDAAGTDDYRRQSFTCHELGHSVGLLHLNNPSNDPNLAGCMYTTNVFKNNLSPHDVQHLNAAY